jgi:hypothetical protein
MSSEIAFAIAALAAVGTLGTAILTAIGLRQKAALSESQEQALRIQDLERRMKDCENARKDLANKNLELATENTRLMRDLLGLKRRERSQ